MSEHDPEPHDSEQEGDTDPPTDPETAADASAPAEPGTKPVDVVSETKSAELVETTEASASIPTVGTSTEESSLRELAAAWLEPISAEQPCGTAAKYEPAYEWIVAEVSKLESLTGEEVDWEKIAERSGTLLKTVSKDLVLASYATAGWVETEGLDGLSRGLALLTELMETSWETMFPPLRRIRARSGSLEWLLERLNDKLADFVPTESNRSQVAQLVQLTNQLDTSIKAHFDGDGVSARSLLRTVSRLEMSLPDPKAAAKEVSPSPSTAATPPVAVAPAPASSPSPSPASVSLDAAPKAFAGGEDASKYLFGVGKSLTSTARTLREADATNPIPYRILRLGCWLHVSSIPPTGPNKKTTIPAPPPALVTRLEQMMANGKWLAIIEETESSCTQYRFWFDLHYLAAKALSALGEEYVVARTAVEGALGSFLRRMPEALELSFADGTPFADAATLDWIADDVLVTGAAQGGGSSARDDEDAELLASARELSKAGKASEALALLQEAADSASSHQRRFRLRLSIAKMCTGSGQNVLAKALFEDLHKEAQARGLADWDPGLATEYLEGYLHSVRALTRTGKKLGTLAEQLYEQLCVLAPALALTRES